MARGFSFKRIWTTFISTFPIAFVLNRTRVGLLLLNWNRAVPWHCFHKSIWIRCQRFSCGDFPLYLLYNRNLIIIYVKLKLKLQQIESMDAIGCKQKYLHHNWNFIFMHLKFRAYRKWNEKPYWLLAITVLKFYWRNSILRTTDPLFSCLMLFSVSKVCCLSDPEILLWSQNYFHRNLKKKLDKMSGIVIKIVTIPEYIWLCRIGMLEIHPMVPWKQWKPVPLALFLSLSLPNLCICKWLNFNHPLWWKMQMECSNFFVCRFFYEEKRLSIFSSIVCHYQFERHAVNVYTYSHSSHQHAHIHLPIVAYNTMHGHTHTHQYHRSQRNGYMRIESRSTMSETLLPRNIPFVSAFTTHQNRFMCVFDTNAHTHTLRPPPPRSPRHSFIFRFYSIEHVLSERCTIKSD